MKVLFSKTTLRKWIVTIDFFLVENNVDSLTIDLYNSMRSRLINFDN